MSTAAAKFALLNIMFTTFIQSVTIVTQCVPQQQVDSYKICSCCLRNYLLITTDLSATQLLLRKLFKFFLLSRIHAERTNVSNQLKARRQYFFILYTS